MKIQLESFGDDIVENIQLYQNEKKPVKEVKSNLILPKHKADQSTTAKINLYDCLACSGCVTSSEVILMQEQGSENFKVLTKNIQNGVFVISPQSRASLAHYYKLSERELIFKVNHYFQRYNIAYILDMNFFRDLSIFLCSKELQTNLSENKKMNLISSECPGWICYLEKTLNQTFLENASKVKTPQMIAGLVVKKFFNFVTKDFVKGDLVNELDTEQDLDSK